MVGVVFLEVGSRIEKTYICIYALDGSWATNKGKLYQIIVDEWFVVMTMVVQVPDH